MARPNLKRLRHLVGVLESVRDNRLPFDMRVWKLVDGPHFENRVTCGMSACAGGWAAMDPTFRADGLTLLRDSPRYKRRMGYAALEQFFSLTEEQASALFEPCKYNVSPIQPGHVIAKIRRIIRAHESRGAARAR